MIAKSKFKHHQDENDKGDRKHRRREKALDEALQNTFPTSDPVSVEQPVLPAAAANVDRESGNPSAAGGTRAYAQSKLAHIMFTFDLARELADAVAVEPVSTRKFPANREKNREFCKIVASCPPETPKK